jgi:hypothetical protein
VQWSEKATQEFFAQGDRDKALGHTPLVMFDREQCNVAKSQIGFLTFVVRPNILALEEFLDPVGPVLQQCLDSNQVYWTAMAEEADRREEEERERLENERLEAAMLSPEINIDGRGDAPDGGSASGRASPSGGLALQLQEPPGPAGRLTVTAGRNMTIRESRATLSPKKSTFFEASLTRQFSLLD